GECKDAGGGRTVHGECARGRIEGNAARQRPGFGEGRLREAGRSDSERATLTERERCRIGARDRWGLVHRQRETLRSIRRYAIACTDGERIAAAAARGGGARKPRRAVAVVQERDA